jgi:hypothetical protein
MAAIPTTIATVPAAPLARTHDHHLRFFEQVGHGSGRGLVERQRNSLCNAGQRRGCACDSGSGQQARPQHDTSVDGIHKFLLR